VKGRRWDPKKVAELVELKDECQFPVTFSIDGNQADPNGNPIPYERQTQRGSFARPQARRYHKWKDYVRFCWVQQIGKRLPQIPNGRYRLDCTVFFKKAATGTCQHADPENVRKGIQDALFPFGDQHVYGSVYYEHVTDLPRVLVTIWKEEVPNAHLDGTGGDAPDQPHGGRA
jgi:hypothetical protein